MLLDERGRPGSLGERWANLRAAAAVYVLRAEGAGAETG